MFKAIINQWWGFVKPHKILSFHIKVGILYSKVFKCQDISTMYVCIIWSLILLYLKSLKNDHCFVDETHRDCQAGIRETGHAISQCRQILEDLYRTRGLFSYISLIRKLFNLRLLWGKIFRKSIFTITFQLIDKWINRFCHIANF